MLISHVKKGQLFFLATFAAMIIGGTCLLALPFGTPGENYPFINAVFMAVSCVSRDLPPTTFVNFLSPVS